MVNRKRVLIFNGYFIPAKNYGGPLTSCKNVIKTCSDEFDFLSFLAIMMLGVKTFSLIYTMDGN